MHGEIALPAFLPDATRGSVRSLDATDVQATGTPGLVMNTYHLMIHPGARTVASLGGLHRFAGWAGPILTDSGGFQVYSLLKENPGAGVVRRREVIFEPSRERKKLILSPEKAIRAQVGWGSDIVMSLDWCTGPDDPDTVNRESVETTVRWARMGKAEFERLMDEPRSKSAGPKSAGPRSPLLFAIIQGGADRRLRADCASRLIELGFDGYGFGGWPLDREGRLDRETLADTARLMPDGLPKYAMGIGKPESIVACARMGYDLFDCVIPTRDARHMRLYTFEARRPDRVDLSDDRFYRVLYLQDREYARDKGPLSEACDCHTCRGYSRAFLHHLFRVGDSLAYRLATIHNLRFYAQLMELIRAGAGGRP